MQSILINLERQPERRIYALAECERVGIKPSILPATDAEKLTDAWLKGNVTEDMLKHLHDPAYRSVNRGSLACSDSHRRAWHWALTQDDSHFLILEDDFFWLANPNIVRSTLAAIKDANYDVVLLGYSPRQPISQTHIQGCDLGYDFKLVPYSSIKRSGGTYGYMMTKSAATAFLSSQSQFIDREADDFAREYQRHGKSLSIGFIFPPLIHSGIFVSSIWIRPELWRSQVKRVSKSLLMRSLLFRSFFSRRIAKRLRKNYVA